MQDRKQVLVTWWNERVRVRRRLDVEITGSLSAIEVRVLRLPAIRFAGGN